MRIFTPSQTHIDDQALHLLHIGSNVVITGPVTILTHDYSSFVCMRRYPERERAVAAMRSVMIGDNVFVGWGATILPGTIIGENTIIGAGAVVSGNIEADSVYAGNPARKIMTLEDFYQRRIARQEGEARNIYKSYLDSFGKNRQQNAFMDMNHYGLGQGILIVDMTHIQISAIQLKNKSWREKTNDYHENAFSDVLLRWRHRYGKLL